MSISLVYEINDAGDMSVRIPPLHEVVTVKLQYGMLCDLDVQYIQDEIEAVLKRFYDIKAGGIVVKVTDTDEITLDNDWKLC